MLPFSLPEAQVHTCQQEKVHRHPKLQYRVYACSDIQKIVVAQQNQQNHHRLEI